MKKILFLSCLSMLFMFLNVKCEDPECNSTIVFYNESADSVYVIPSFQYPQTDTFYNKPSAKYKVFSNEANSNALLQSFCYQDIFKSSSVDTMLVFIVDAFLNDQKDSIVINDYLIYSLEDLKRSNFEIHYNF